MKILIAADSFKDALPASDVCQAIAAGVWAARPQAEIRICPLADGGEGAYDVLSAELGLENIEIAAVDPLFRPIKSSYGYNAATGTAFIEMARTAGIQLLTLAERNPLLTTSFGVGQQIEDAMRRGARRLVLAIGGSATNDAGIGMAAALGWRFLDQNGTELSPTGDSLSKIAMITAPVTRPGLQVEVICDVTNPLFGAEGAAYIYARQKGADDAMIVELDHGLQHFAQVLSRMGPAPLPDAPGSGAAGGMGYGAMYFLQAGLRRGVELVLDLLHFGEKLDWADLVITGEGKIDIQTAHGKLIQGLCSRAAQYNKPVIGLCGRLEATEQDVEAIGLKAAYCINEHAQDASLEEMLENTGANLERTARQIMLG